MHCDPVFETSLTKVTQFIWWKDDLNVFARASAYFYFKLVYLDWENPVLAKIKFC